MFLDEERFQKAVAALAALQPKNLLEAKNFLADVRRLADISTKEKAEQLFKKLLDLYPQQIHLICNQLDDLLEATAELNFSPEATQPQIKRLLAADD